MHIRLENSVLDCTPPSRKAWVTRLFARGAVSATSLYTPLSRGVGVVLTLLPLFFDDDDKPCSTQGEPWSARMRCAVAAQALAPNGLRVD